jgi:hypothetical protein
MQVLSEITRRDVRAFVNRLLADELDPSTIRNTIMPLRVVFRDALQQESVALGGRRSACRPDPRRARLGL